MVDYPALEQTIDETGQIMEKELKRLGIRAKYGPRSEGKNTLHDLVHHLKYLNKGSEFSISDCLSFSVRNLEFGSDGGCINWGDGEYTILPAGVCGLQSHQYLDGKTEHTVMINGLKKIGDSAFKDNANLKKVFLKSEVKVIDDNSFKNSGITELSMEHVERINDYAFMDCVNLNKVILSDNCNFLGKFAFRNCKRLSTVLMSDNIKHVHDGCFMGCSSLENIRLSDNIAHLYPGVFMNCSNLSKIYLPANLGECEDDCFSNTSLKSLIIPDKIRLININFQAIPLIEYVKYTPSELRGVPIDTFKDCKSLKHVELENINILGEDAFWGCVNLTEFTVPATVTQVYNAFRDSGLKRIIFNTKAPPILAKDCFKGCKNLIVFVPRGGRDSYEYWLKECGASYSIIEY